VALPIGPVDPGYRGTTAPGCIEFLFISENKKKKIMYFKKVLPIKKAVFTFWIGTYSMW